MKLFCTTPNRPLSTSKFYVDFKKNFSNGPKNDTHLLFFDVLLIVGHFFELKNSRVRSLYLPRTHKRSSDGISSSHPDFSLSKVTALKVVWGKDTSSRNKEPGSDLASCFSAWAPFCKCGWRHHISRSGCGPDWFRHSSNSRELSWQKFHNELAYVFTAHDARKNADWNQQQLTAEQRKSQIVRIDSYQVIGSCSYPIRKKSRFWLFCMWSVRGLYHALLPKIDYRDKWRGHDRRLLYFLTVNSNFPRRIFILLT